MVRNSPEQIRARVQHVRSNRRPTCAEEGLDRDVVGVVRTDEQRGEAQQVPAVSTPQVVGLGGLQPHQLTHITCYVVADPCRRATVNEDFQLSAGLLTTAGSQTSTERRRRRQASCCGVRGACPRDANQIHSKTTGRHMLAVVLDESARLLPLGIERGDNRR